jgi:hypothetical protein
MLPCLVGCAFERSAPNGVADAPGLADAPLGATVPTAWWRLDEGAGNTTTDATGHLAAGTLANGANWTQDRRAVISAVMFDGSQSVVDAGAGASVNDLASISIAAWIRPASFALPNGDGQRIVAKEGDVSTGRWMLIVDGTAQLAFVRDFTALELRRMTTAGALALAQWQHVAVTWDGSSLASSVRLYVGGVEATAATVMQDADGTFVSDAGLHVLIGNRLATDRGFDGAIDDVQIYRRVLSSGEIAILAAP